MTLKEFLSQSDMTAEQFAARIGASRFAVGKWVRGERIPRRDVMTQILEVTGGKVTADDFYRPAVKHFLAKARQVFGGK